MRPIRRVVTGHNQAGKSVVLFDDHAAQEAGLPVANIWGNHETPADLRGREDVAAAGFHFNPPPGGAVLRCAEIAPESTFSHMHGDALREMMRDRLTALGGPEAVVDQTRHWGMHRTRSIDYVVLLSGNLTLLLDEGEVEIKPFDVVIQRGTNHTWINRSSEPATLLAVMVDADLPRPDQ